MLFFLKRFLKIGLSVIIILSLFFIILVETTLQPILNNICEVEVTGMLTTVINKGINKATNGLSYNDMVRIQTNRQGHIILMEPNLKFVNRLSSDITLEIQTRLDNLSEKVITIPISQIFGVEVLSKFSPRVNARIIPHGAVKTDVVDEFDSVGINQTRHRLYLKVNTKVRVVVPLTGTEIAVNTQVPMTEAVIVGQVPQVYVGLEKGLFKEGVIKKE
ncbi:sporulation protein YunB [Orenia metallireducens]|uniref:Sporulation protein YunB n=1 Tax=Orenia metallireducens TaxID=1413210 RepID=A0A285I8Y3_9FIRM|nr:sporulation protein YunB [Orenia metallireducens]PRX21670.1 sporulation protein YunB [Orenia metallireducens]SNY44267.1 sporulation protein YunB [Orenia metallireducens]